MERKPKCKMNPNSLRNLKPPFKKGEVHNPEGANGFGLHRFLDRRVAREIARAVRRKGLKVTPAMVCLVFIKTIFPKLHANEKRLHRAMRALLPVFQREMRRESGQAPTRDVTHPGENC